MAQRERAQPRAPRRTHRKGTTTERPAPPQPQADTARPQEAHARQDTPPKHGPDAARTAPAHANRQTDPAQGKGGTPTRGKGATPTEGAADNTAAQPTTTCSPPGHDPGHSKGHHTATRRGKGHGRHTQD